MILHAVRGVTDEGKSDGGDQHPSGGSGGSKIPVTVLFTTIEGTLAGLRAAANLSRGLRARIVVVAAEAISFPFLFQGMRDSALFFQRLCEAIVTESKLQDVGIEVHICRDKIKCLQQELRPRSIVIIGARRCWWPRRERQVERNLSALGFDALFVQATTRPEKAGSLSVVQRMVEAATNAGGM